MKISSGGDWISQRGTEKGISRTLLQVGVYTVHMATQASLRLEQWSLGLVVKSFLLCCPARDVDRRF